MSGGFGYVLDLDPGLVNGELVDVQPLSSDSADAVRRIVAEHAELTDSPVARALVADWPASAARFSVLAPRDYVRVLETTRQAQATGADVDEAIMAAARS
jgi:glutamate synthase (NADPH/NADH) large chain